jgi:hypothetical protein
VRLQDNSEKAYLHIQKHCAPWLTVFPGLKNVTLVPAGLRSGEEIEQIRNCFLNNAVNATDLDVKVSVY